MEKCGDIVIAQVVSESRTISMNRTLIFLYTSTLVLSAYLIFEINSSLKMQIYVLLLLRYM